MTPAAFHPRLTPTQARAAATGNGWDVTLHEHGGFSAQAGEHRMMVDFDEDRAFRCAHVQEGVDGMPMEVSEGAVVGMFARHGKPHRPASSEEKTG